MAKGHGAKKLSKMIKNKKMKSRTLFRDFLLKPIAITKSCGIMKAGENNDNPRKII